jgi:hypothetical protein
MSSTGDGTVIPSAPEPQRPARSLARAQVRVVSEAGGHEGPQSRRITGNLLALTAADDVDLSRAYATPKAPAAAIETVMLEYAGAVVSAIGNRGRPARRSRHPGSGRYPINGPAFDRLTARLGSEETRRRVLSGLGLAISALFVGRSIIGRITAGTGPPGPSTTGRCTRQCNADAKAARAACGVKVKTSNARDGCRSEARTTREACRAGCPPKEEAPVAVPPDESGT